MIFSTHPLDPEVTRQLAALAPYVVASAPHGAAILSEGRDAEILVVRAPVPAAYFAAAGRLRAAVRHGAGLDMIPMAEATAAGVLVANVPGANAGTVAEHVIFAALGLMRRFRAMDIALRQQGWAAARGFSDDNRELAGATMGILGYGNIGQALAPLARAFGMKVIVHSRRPVTADPVPDQVDLASLAASSDVLVLACPLTEATRGIIGPAQIGAMRPGAILVNVARGPVVDMTALLPALQAGRISAALDVFEVQPLPSDHPLMALDNVILTPHLAGITQQSMRRMGLGVVAEVTRILAGAMPVNFCNPEVEPRYRQRFPAA